MWDDSQISSHFFFELVWSDLPTACEVNSSDSTQTVFVYGRDKLYSYCWGFDSPSLCRVKRGRLDAINEVIDNIHLKRNAVLTKIKELGPQTSAISDCVLCLGIEFMTRCSSISVEARQ